MKFSLKKIFVLISILFISFMIGFYGTRLIYFYRIEHKKSNKNYNLVEYLKKDEFILNTTLRKEKNNYYFYKNSKNNYIYFSGLMYRILYFNNDSVFLISDNAVTNIKFGLNGNYSDSNIKKWLNNNYIKNIDSDYLKNKTASLLSIDIYNKIGAEKSFVVNDDFWVLDNGNALVVDQNGSLTKTSNYGDFLGLKPVIELKGDIKYLTGEGIKNNPILIENKVINTLNDLSVGEYIKYKDNKYRVISNNQHVKVVSVDKLKEQHIYSNYSNKYSLKYKNDLGYYLNNIYIKNLNKEDLIKVKWYYSETENINAYVGLLNINDFFLKDIKNSYLLTTNNNQIYTINKDGYLFVDEINKKLDIYPSFVLNGSLKIKSGNGYNDNPYVVGDLNEKN